MASFLFLAAYSEGKLPGSDREGDVYQTLVLSELSNAPRTSGDSLNHPGAKVLLFKLFRAPYTLLFLSVSANSARKENKLST